jgi:hypothetical protein
MKNLKPELVKKSIEVLKFWHIVEFFVPFDLDEISSKPNASYTITEDQLNKYGNFMLPWLSKEALAETGSDILLKYKYNIYLSTF